VWQEVLRCVSRWELLQQIASGGPSDALLFAAPAEPVAAVKRRNFFSRAPKDGGVLCTPVLSCVLMAVDIAHIFKEHRAKLHSFQQSHQ
jgi:hypothetical protein